MTPDTKSTRDRLAKELGWRPRRSTYNRWLNETKQAWSDTHPIPDTADAALACFPEGWVWGRMLYNTGGKYWYAYGPEYEADGEDDYHRIEIPDTGNIKTDLFTLALKCVQAEKERKSNAK